MHLKYRDKFALLFANLPVNICSAGRSPPVPIAGAARKNNFETMSKWPIIILGLTGLATIAWLFLLVIGAYHILSSFL
jgi:hypothetical protein